MSEGKGWWRYPSCLYNLLLLWDTGVQFCKQCHHQAQKQRDIVPDSLEIFFLLLLFSNKVLLLSPRALCYLSDNKNRATQRKLIMWIYLLHLHLPKEGGKKVFQTPQLTQWVGAGLHTGLNVPYFSKDKRSRWQEEGDRMKIVSLLKDKTQNWSYTENWVVKLGGERSSLIMEGWEKHFISLSTCSCSKRMLPTKKLFNFRKRRRKIEQNLL